MQKWYEAFPVAYVCLGNHDQLPYRKAFTAGLPKSWLKNFGDLIQAPKEWIFAERHIINDVIYEHGIGSNGDMAAVNRAKENRMSTVMGHGHSFAGVRYLSSTKDTIFGMNVGCGINEESYAAAYGRFQSRRPVISCGVVLDYGRNAAVLTM